MENVTLGQLSGKWCVFEVPHQWGGLRKLMAATRSIGAEDSWLKGLVYWMLTGGVRCRGALSVFIRMNRCIGLHAWSAATASTCGTIHHGRYESGSPQKREETRELAVGWSASDVTRSANSSGSRIPPLRADHSKREQLIMDGLVTIGRFFFAIAMASFGVQYFIYAGAMNDPIPGPPWTPGARWLAWLTGIALIAIAVSIATGKRSRLAAMLLRVALFLKILFLHLYGLITQIRSPGHWTVTFELLALCGASFVLANIMPPDESTRQWTTLGLH